MNKKTYTVLFTIISTIVNIALTLSIIVALMILIAFVYFKILGYQELSSAFLIALMISFFVGLVLGLVVFTKLCSWVIDRFNLDQKLDPKALGHYLPNGKKNLGASKNAEEKKPKTNIPKSPVMIDDEWARDVENGSSQQGHAPDGEGDTD